MRTQRTAYMRVLGLMLGIALVPISILSQRSSLSDPPVARSPLVLTAVYDKALGHNAFAYHGKTVPPVIRVRLGHVVKLHYINDLPTSSSENCATGPCSNMTNLHFHGLHVSPKSPQDDVLNMMAMPGESLDYTVVIPSYAPPGLYWYHTHPHGESARQDLDGMSGPLIIEGIERYYPQLRNMRERVIILRDKDLQHLSSASLQSQKRLLGISSLPCGKAKEQRLDRAISINGQTRPFIPIGPGERQFWRIVNSSPDRYTDLEVSSGLLEVIALDGVPLAYRDPDRTTHIASHVLLPPGGRVEAIVIGPPTGSKATLNTRCVDTGPDGDSNPAMVIADIGSPTGATSTGSKPWSPERAEVRESLRQRIQQLEGRPPDFTVVFSEDRSGFYINGRKFSMDDPPLRHVKVGSMEHWRIVNASNEAHPFHIHQVHFLAYAENNIFVDSPAWLDTVNVPYGNGTVDLIMDFTDPIIKGISVFHCHLLSHEDKGMMAKIVFE